MKRDLLRTLFTSLMAVVCMSVNAQATSGSCGENATWEYDGGTLTISGTGAMADYTYGETPWSAYAETMTSLVIEEGITSIGSNAFAGFENLNSVTFPASGFTSIGDYAFSGAKVKYPNLPNTLTYLGAGAFAGSQAKGVSIPASLKKIGDYAFNDCKLEGVAIYEGVEEIGEGAFDNAFDNESDGAFVVSIPNSVTKVGGGAFMSNTKLETVTFGEGLKEIGAAAFQGCTGLKEIGLFCNSRPALGDAVFTEYDGTTPLGIEAFYYPYGVNYDGWGGYDSSLFHDAFYGTWTNSTDESEGSGNWSFDVRERKLTITGTGKVNVAPWNDKPAINPQVYVDKDHPGFWGGIKQCAIGNGITSLENMVCGMQINCTSVTLPNTLKTITNSALEECAFTSIDLPEGLETIDMYAFFGSKLTSITIPSTVTYIGASAFLYNEDLEVVTMLPTTPPGLYTGELPFGECEKLTAIYVKDGLADTYKDTEGWSTYKAIIYDAPTTTFTYTATEKETDFDDYTYFKGAMSLKSHDFDGTNGTVVYEGYVTAVGQQALTYTKLTSITIPESVTSINKWAFQGNDKLESVNFAGTPALTTIGQQAFRSCKAMTAFTVPATVKTIDESAFSGCSELATFTFDGTPTVTTIGDAAFQDCKKLTAFTIPESVTTLGTTVFWYAGLTSLNIPAGVTSIGQALFCACPLTSLTVDAGNAKYADLGCNGIFEKATNKLIAGGAATTIPDGIVAIGEEAFWGENGAFALSLPESVTTIESRAFHMTSGLTSVNIPSGVTHIDAETFFFCEMSDVYCYSIPTITWDGGMKDEFSLMNPKSTKFHVAAADLTVWETNFPDANVTFVGDLAPAVAGNAVDGAYWATYYNSAANMKADANTIVYKAAISESSLTLTEIADKVINAGEAVILKSTGASIAMTASAAASAADYSDNALEGVDVATAVDGNYKYYVLSNENSTLGFYTYTGATLGANKAFIKVAVGSPAPAFYAFDFGGTTTDLSEKLKVNSDKFATAPIYNLNGQRVNQPTKGLYIVNGKKVIVK